MKKLLVAGLVCMVCGVVSMTAGGEEMWPKKLVVTVPVADVRVSTMPSKNDYKYDKLEETQVLYGERLTAFEEMDGWYRVEAIEQPEFNHNSTWQGYPGWIEQRMVMIVNDYPERNAVLKEKNVPIYENYNDTTTLKIMLSMGTRLYVTKSKTVEEWSVAKLVDGTTGWIANDQFNLTGEETKQTLPEPLLRIKLLNTAEKFLGDRYLWGGRSGHFPASESKGINIRRKGEDEWSYQIATGVDCSGLTNLSYRVNGIYIPRDAHEQWMKCTRITRKEMKPGDLVFLAKKSNTNRMVHVMMYFDKEKLLESPHDNEVARIIGFKDKIGKLMAEVEDGGNVGEFHVYYGRYVEK